MANKQNDYYLQRGFNAEFRAAGEDEGKTGHIVSGLASVYGEEIRMIDPLHGEYYEIIERGAFDNTDFSDVRLLVNHDTRGIPLARSRRNTRSDKPNTMQLQLTERGLEMRADLDTVNNEQARALYSAIDRGDMDGMSFIMFVGDDGQKWTKRDDGFLSRKITHVKKVIEISAVNFPAYPGTNIDARSLDSDRRALDSATAALDSAQKNTTVEALRLRAEILSKH